MKKVLVTGGCGYIGSHTIVDLLSNDFEVISVDNLSRSDGSAIQGIEAITGKKVHNYQVDLCDLEATRSIFEKEKGINGIIHFAAFKAVGESVDEPLLYYDNNLNALLNILHCVSEFKVPNFVFSSSCSVYGNSTALPVTENTEMAEAESPYAATKQIGERIITDFAVTGNTNSILLRYFNPVGAHKSALIGEKPFGAPNNLVPRITGTAIGKYDQLNVLGHDYETRDGTCVRDYIHVMDIANAHTKALEYLIKTKNEGNLEIFNLGTGKGVTVLEAIKAFETVSGQTLNYKLADRRPGDVVAVYANNEKAQAKLNWSCVYDIDEMMRSAWAWEQKLASEA